MKNGSPLKLTNEKQKLFVFYLINVNLLKVVSQCIQFVYKDINFRRCTVKKKNGKMETLFNGSLIYSNILFHSGTT